MSEAEERISELEDTSLEDTQIIRNMKEELNNVKKTNS